MLVVVTQLGKVKSIRFPENIGEVCEIPSRMELLVLDRGIVLRPWKHDLRKDWKSKFDRMRSLGEDSLILGARDATL